MNDNTRTEVTPVLTLVLGREARPLAARTTLAIARRSPDVARLTTSVDLVGRIDALEHLFRQGVERITDIRRRNAVVRRGFEIRDEILVPILLELGSQVPSPDAVRGVLERIRTLTAAAYAGTRIDTHLFLLLPDLAERADREARYATAYEQLAAIEADSRESWLSVPGQVAITRWMADCRTAAGAYPGTITDVLEPISEFVASLAVGRAAGDSDAVHRHVLRGMEHERITGFSAPGYAELVFRPSVIMRHMACRLGQAVVGDRLRAAEAVWGAGDAEREVEAAFETLEMHVIAENLPRIPRKPPEGRSDEEWASQREHLRARSHDLLHDRASDCLLAKMKEVVDGAGVPAAKLLLAACSQPVAHPSLQQIYPSVTIKALDVAARLRLARVLRIDSLRAEAERLDAEAQRGEPTGDDPAAVGQPLDAPPQSGVSEEAVRAARARTAALRTEATRLRALADRRERLCAASTAADLHDLEEELFAENAAGLAAAAPALADGHRAPIGAPETAGAPSWIRRVFSGLRARRSADDPNSAPAKALEAAVAATPPESRMFQGPSDHTQLAEWLRWMIGLRVRLQALEWELGRFETELNQVTEFYDREREALLTEATEGTAFSHRLLSQQRCAAMYEERAGAMVSRLSASGALPLSKYFAPGAPALEPLQHPVNERLTGLDRALDAAASAELQEVLAVDLEDALFGDMRSSTGSALDMIRALADSAQPLSRPEDDRVPGVRTVVALLPRDQEDSGIIPLLSRVGASTALTEKGEPGRFALRTAKHGFPAFAVQQLRRVREGHLAVRGKAFAPAADPLPYAHLVGAPDAEIALSLALGKALGLTSDMASRLGLHDPAWTDDEPVVSHRLRTTIAGREELANLQRRLWAELRRGPESARRLQAALGAGDVLNPAQEAAVAFAVTELTSGRWPEALPMFEEEVHA